MLQILNSILWLIPFYFRNVAISCAMINCCTNILVPLLSTSSPIPGLLVAYMIEKTLQASGPSMKRMSSWSHAECESGCSEIDLRPTCPSYCRPRAHRRCPRSLENDLTVDCGLFLVPGVAFSSAGLAADKAGKTISRDLSVSFTGGVLGHRCAWARQGDRILSIRSTADSSTNPF